MKTKVINIKYEKNYDVYIGRPSKWGNPFTHLKGKSLAKYVVNSSDEAVKKYEEYIRNSPKLLKDLHELKGKTLGCWCKPRICHGDILIKLLYEDDNEIFQ